MFLTGKAGTGKTTFLKEIVRQTSKRFAVVAPTGVAAINAGEAKCGFFGKIVIAPDAQRTEAFQENHNILLSDTARVNTKPRLEIYADDVKCSHGATVGKLNEDEQFYMRSRGIPEDEAKVLQMISFVAPVLETILEEATDGDLSRSAVAGL